jgi:hypothetical protein
VISGMSEVSVYKPTNELSQVLGKPALVGREKVDDYDRLFELIASAIKPSDLIGWLATKSYTDLSWDILRERTIKAEIIKFYHKEVVAKLIKSLAPPGQLGTAIYRIFQADDDITLWETDPVGRAEIDAALAAKGHSAIAILAQAYMRGAAQIDAIDKRIALYERRRSIVLTEAGIWNDQCRQRLVHATVGVIDGEFTEASE